MTYTAKALTSYLEDIDIPVLTSTYRNKLDRPITVEEIFNVLKTLQSGKTPGPDGIPVAFYKQYAEDLATILHKMLSESVKSEALPNSMGEVVIVVILKQGKNPSLCSSYHLFVRCR